MSADKKIKEVSGPFKVRFEEIGRKRAQELLSTQGNDMVFKTQDDLSLSQRSIARGRVNLYASDIEAGFWETTHQGIALDEDGRLIDGQHRLRALIEATNTPEKRDLTIVMMVCYGVSRDTFYLIDGGFVRSAQSFLSGPYSIQRAALARTLMRIEEYKGVADISTVGNGKYASHRVLNYLAQHEDVREYGTAFSKASKAATVHGKFEGTSAVGLLVGGYLTGEANWVKWWEDVNALATGDGVLNGNPLKALFNAPMVGGNMTSVNYMRAIYTAVKYRDSVQLKQLRAPAYHKVTVW